MIFDIYPPTAQSSPKKKKSSIFNFVKYLFLLLILAIIAFFVLGYFGRYIDKLLELEPISLEKKVSVGSKPKSLKAEAQQTNQSTSSPSLPSQPSQSSSDQPSSPSQPSSPATLDKASFKIQILNGNAIWGAATKAKELLESNGFKVSATGNAENQNYTVTTIYYKTGKNAEAETVKTFFDQNGSNVVLEENNVIAGDVDLTVVIGKN